MDPQRAFAPHWSPPTPQLTPPPAYTGAMTAGRLSFHWGCLLGDWSLQNIVQLAVETTLGLVWEGEPVGGEGGGVPIMFPLRAEKERAPLG